MLEHSQIAGLLSGKNDPLWVCNIADKVRTRYGCSSGAVYLSKKSAEHILSEHADTFELLVLPIVISNGKLLFDPMNERMIFVIHEIEDRKFYFAALKTAENGHELWVCSLYRIRKEQVLAKLKRYHRLAEPAAGHLG